MTQQQLYKTFENDALVETREIDLATNTFTRRDDLGNVVEQRPLSPQETDLLNAKTAKAARDAAFGLAKADTNALPGNSPTKQILVTILDELSILRGD